MPGNSAGAATVTATAQMPKARRSFPPGTPANRTGGAVVTEASRNPTAATAVATGTKRTLYGSVFYHLSRRAEVYLAADRMWLLDGYRLAVTNGYSTQTEIATGIRFRF